MKSSRRTFLITSIGVASTLALSRTAFADAPKVAETDPTAQALGYKADASKVDKAKFAKYAAGQDCGNCSFYQGKADRRLRWLPDVRRQTGCEQRLVQRV